jgi:hypothetical protein
MTEIKSKVEEEVLEFDARIKPTVVSGCKTTTIRMGYRYFKRYITIGKQPAVVNWQHHFILSTVPLTILMKEGFVSIFDAIIKLQRYYPNINLNTPVTVIEFRIDVLDGGSTHPVDKAVRDWRK